MHVSLEKVLQKIGRLTIESEAKDEVITELRARLQTLAQANASLSRELADARGETVTSPADPAP